MAETKKTAFEVLNAINVNEHTEVKDTGKVKLTYLSWAWAWAEVKKKFPDAQYEIVKFNGLPYISDPNTGYMVYTTVTIDGITHEMWLPVMDGNNRAMKSEPYEVQTKYSKSTVQPATMFDVNKAIMRCLTKNLAMFGLGLYIYAGEDLPEQSDEQTVSKPKSTAKAKEKAEETKPQISEESKKIRREFVRYCESHKDIINMRDYNLTNDSTDRDFENALADAMARVENATLTDLPFPLDV